jgi:hypothetical protein
MVRQVIVAEDADEDVVDHFGVGCFIRATDSSIKALHKYFEQNNNNNNTRLH